MLFVADNGNTDPWKLPDAPSLSHPGRLRVNLSLAGIVEYRITGSSEDTDTVSLIGKDKKILRELIDTFSTGAKRVPNWGEKASTVDPGFNFELGEENVCDMKGFKGQKEIYYRKHSSYNIWNFRSSTNGPQWITTGYGTGNNYMLYLYRNLILVVFLNRSLTSLMYDKLLLHLQ